MWSTFDVHSIHRRQNSDFQFQITARIPIFNLIYLPYLLADPEYHLCDDVIRWHDPDRHPACCAGDLPHLLDRPVVDLARVQQDSP